MHIKETFKKPIDRPINGVVKADQLDASSVWQELDEYVITHELDKHIRRFFDTYLTALATQGSSEAAGSIGIWVSGFFGSGKSHFIKVLSYLLGNKVAEHEGEQREAVSFFEDKIDDAMLYGDIKRAVSEDTDVILFNIDSKADKNKGEAAILTVFLKVFNEMLEYSGDHPHIAHMERYLDKKGKLCDFYQNFEEETGLNWVDERDAYEFNRDEVIAALAKTLGQSEESAAQWVDNADENFSLTVENFCKWVKEYLDSKGPKHRLVFFVDEVGQFIGDDTGLMLNLQTITEELGITCGGRAWIVVTSQEDVDAVLGGVKSSKANDFSKIQGRFQTRLSLSSANTDEVIQARLLEKTEDAENALHDLFAQKGDVLKNQLTFTNVGMTFRTITSKEDFSINYPFTPYQFQLVQKVFESIRKAGATGLHLARGERSMLDAFQSASVAVMDKPLGTLIPMYLFYPSIESFLDTAVKRTIDQASTNTSLKDFDIQLLKTLFLIRYVDEMKGNVDNLVTLLLDEVDADKLNIRKAVEESLARLEKETLIKRNGDVYYFLTNEEQDVSRQIEKVNLDSGEEARFMGDLIFEELLAGNRKHRYEGNKKDFSFNRLCDLHPIGNRGENNLLLSVVTPMADGYEMFDDAQCILKSNEEDGHVLVKLADDTSLAKEMQQYLQTEKYISRKYDGRQAQSIQSIINRYKDENRERKNRLIATLDEMLAGADIYVAGQKFDTNTGSAKTAIAEAFNNLINNTFGKMTYIGYTQDDPKREIQSVLRTNDIGQQTLAVQSDDGNARAVDEVRNYIDLAIRSNRKIVLNELIQRFEGRPYGWAELETMLLLARLIVFGEISFIKGGEAVPTADVYDAVSRPANWRNIVVRQRKSSPTESIQSAKSLGQKVFGEIGPDSEDALFGFLRERLSETESALREYNTLADTGNYPGLQEIETGLNLVARFKQSTESVDFIQQFCELKDDLVDFYEEFHDVDHFYKHQRNSWDKLRKARDGFKLNALELNSNEEAAAKLKRIEEILDAPAPYALISGANPLIEALEQINNTLIAEERQRALDVIREQKAQVETDLDTNKASEELTKRCLSPFGQLESDVTTQNSLAHIAQALTRSESLLDNAAKRIEEEAAKASESTQNDKADTPSPTVVKKSRIVEPSKLAQKTYLETKDDVEEFVDALRKELDNAIDNDERIRIR